MLVSLSNIQYVYYDDQMINKYMVGYLKSYNRVQVYKNDVLITVRCDIYSFSQIQAEILLNNIFKIKFHTY